MNEPVRVLLVVRNKSRRALLGRWLRERFRVMEVDGLADSPDLAILDGAGFDFHEAAILDYKRQQAPLFAPILLLATAKDAQLAARSLGRSADDLLRPPLDQAEVLARIHNLLRTRALSSQPGEARYRASEDRHHQLFEASQAIMLLVDPEDESIVDANAEACRFYGWTREQLRARRIQDFALPGPPSRHKRADGSLRDVEVSKSPLPLGGRQLACWTVRDVTEHKLAQRAQLRYQRFMRVALACEKSALLAVDEQSLLEEVCGHLVELGGFRLAWVGYARDDEARSVSPVAYAGWEAGYLQTIEITWGEGERGLGPTGTAIREMAPAICRDMANDPRFVPWRPAALERGFASSIAVPLVDESGRCLGALTCYSSERSLTVGLAMRPRRSC